MSLTSLRVFVAISAIGISPLWLLRNRDDVNVRAEDTEDTEVMAEDTSDALLESTVTSMPWTKACVAGEKNTYVDGDVGKDWAGRDGTDEEKPFKTIQYAVDRRENCTTINIKNGTYRNNGYDATHSTERKHWKMNNNNKVVNLDGVENLIIRNYGNDTVVIKFDGPGAFVGGSKNDLSKTVKDVEIYGLEIEGPNKNIAYADAYADRTSGSKYYNGRGIAIWRGQRIHIHDMLVHDCPAAGLRVDNSDYVVIEDSEVYDNDWWSIYAESAIVLAQSINIDEDDKVKMILRNNKVYGNMNKIPYYNKNYNYDYTPLNSNVDCTVASCKDGYMTCPWQCRYGKITQDYIIDGMGVYVTRNSDTYLKGQMELSDNECYGNGINGLVFHKTFRGKVMRNKIYDNGVVPKDGHPEIDPQDWMIPLNKTRQPYSGLTINNADGVAMWSNKVRARYADDYAFTMQIDANKDYDLKAGGNNRVCRGQVDGKLDSYVRSDKTATDPNDEECTFGS